MREGEVVDGRFEVIRAAGAGGMGRVYEARDLRSGAKVVSMLRATPERMPPTTRLPFSRSRLSRPTK